LGARSCHRWLAQTGADAPRSATCRVSLGATRLLPPAPRVQDTSGGDPSWKRDGLLLSQRVAAGIAPHTESPAHSERPRSAHNSPTNVTPAEAGAQVTRPLEIGRRILPRHPHCCPRNVPLIPPPRCSGSRVPASAGMTPVDRTFARHKRHPRAGGGPVHRATLGRPTHSPTMPAHCPGILLLLPTPRCTVS
jgi:hypothetical protein